MRSQFKNPNFYLMLLADALSVSLALWLAYALRFDFFKSSDFTANYQQQLFPSMGFSIPLKLLLFFLFGLYRGMWRYTNLHDMRKIMAATAVSSLLLVVVVNHIYTVQKFSRGLYLLDALLTFIFVAGLRIIVRECFALRTQGRAVNPLRWGLGIDRPKRTRSIVIGAGYCGEHLLRELSVDKNAQYDVVCYLDDDPKKQHRSLHGITIYGGLDRLPAAIEKYQAELILIAITQVDGVNMRRIIEACEACGLPFKRVPSHGSVIDGRVSLKELRDINYEDLLGRPSVVLDDSAVAHYLEGKTVLVTGAGGSIGSELCRQVAAYNPKRFILVDSGEENLFRIQMQLAHDHLDVVPVLGQVQDRQLMRELFAHHRPHVVFHAAAYKHVPMIETNPWQAVTNNILGTYTVAEAAVESGAERFVLVSTDKAVRSTNVMGASKRMAERILHAFNGGSTRMMAVRFGNVVGSSGSVVPTFRDQILKGGPITVTHPEVTRYFMTIPEASRLILQAGALGEGGEIFILHMGTPVRIVDMARDLIRLSGKDPDTDIAIEFTGLRPGEKLYEELISDEEGVVPTSHEKIMVLRPENGTTPKIVKQQIDALLELAAGYQGEAIKARLLELVPDYTPQSSATVF